MICDDDYTASRDLGVQAPRNRTPSRSGMPHSALDVERGHGDVMADGGNRVDTAEAASSLHPGPIGYSVPVGTIQYNIRLLHRSQTATTSNMKHMNTKYNSRIT